MDVVRVLEQRVAAVAERTLVRWDPVAFVGCLVTGIGLLLEGAECPLLQEGQVVVVVTLSVGVCLAWRV